MVIANQCIKMEQLTHYQIVLASKSPRRRELLQSLGLQFTTQVLPDIDESYPESLPTADIPLYIAKEKADAYMDQLNNDTLLITADTLVIVDNQVLGKPADAEDAARMLHLISGRTHHVITGVCMTTLHHQERFSVTTEVTFKALTDSEISYYVSHYQPFDKAGAYGIQEWIGYVGVTGLKGSYYNVMGLPVQKIWEHLKAFVPNRLQCLEE